MKRKVVIDAFVLLFFIAAMVYVVARTLLLEYAGYHGTDRITAVLLLAGELFIILHGIGYALNIARAYAAQKKQNDLNTIAHFRVEKEPSVAVLVAARHEPKEVLENTLISLRNLKYANKDIYLLDDSSLENYRKEADELVYGFGIHLFRSQKRRGAKAGIINDCVKTLTHKYIVIFDADQNPLPEFLNRVISIMESDKRLAFVQTPQFYTNIEESTVARAAAFQQAVFYEYICEGKSSQEAMFCCGTNIVFQREALLDVGGLDETTVTEDFATALKLHQKGWKSLYYNHTCAFGMAPQNLASYFRQQYRWANGTITVFKRVISGLFVRPFSLSLQQWWEYFLSGTYYVTGLAFFILMIFPLLYLLFKIPSFFARPEVYLLAFLPYISLSLGIFYFVLKTRSYTIKDLFLGQLLGSIAFPVYIRALCSSFVGIKTTFGITQKNKGAKIPYIRLWFHLFLIGLNYFAVVWGVNRFMYEQEAAILINAFWALFHCIILSSLFYFNEEPL